MLKWKRPDLEVILRKHIVNNMFRFLASKLPALEVSHDSYFEANWTLSIKGPGPGSSA